MPLITTSQMGMGYTTLLLSKGDALIYSLIRSCHDRIKLVAKKIFPKEGSHNLGPKLFY